MAPPGGIVEIRQSIMTKNDDWLFVSLCCWRDLQGRCRRHFESRLCASLYGFALKTIKVVSLGRANGDIHQGVSATRPGCLQI